MSGGSGFVSSREAVRLFVKSAIVNKSGCDINNHYIPDDVAIGECFRAVDVIAGDSRDVHGEARVYLFAPYMMLMPEAIREPFWYFNFSFYNPRSVKKFSLTSLCVCLKCFSFFIFCCFLVQRLSCEISYCFSLYFSKGYVS